MIAKITVVQPVGDHQQRDFRKAKEEFNKGKKSSFASVLGKIIKTQSTAQ